MTAYSDLLVLLLVASVAGGGALASLLPDKARCWLVHRLGLEHAALGLLSLSVAAAVAIWVLA